MAKRRLIRLVPLATTLLTLVVAGCTALSQVTDLVYPAQKANGAWNLQVSGVPGGQVLPVYWTLGVDGAGTVAGTAVGQDCEDGLVVGSVRGSRLDVQVQFGSASPSEFVGTVSTGGKSISGTQPSVWLAYPDATNQGAQCQATPMPTPAASPSYPCGPRPCSSSPSGITGGVGSN